MTVLHSAFSSVCLLRDDFFSGSGCVDICHCLYMTTFPSRELFLHFQLVSVSKYWFAFLCSPKNSRYVCASICISPSRAQVSEPSYFYSNFWNYRLGRGIQIRGPHYMRGTGINRDDHEGLGAFAATGSLRSFLLWLVGDDDGRLWVCVAICVAVLRGKHLVSRP